MEHLVESQSEETTAVCIELMLQTLGWRRRALFEIGIAERLKQFQVARA
jgi:hypothetical protein